MKERHDQFLRLLGQPPAWLTAEQAAWVLNCQSHDVPVLVATRLLKPLGSPTPNSVKYFGTADVVEKPQDTIWLAKVTNTLYQHWQQKDGAKRSLKQDGPMHSISLPNKAHHIKVLGA